MQHAGTAGLSRRRVLAALALAPVAVAGCAFDRTADGPDPLLVLADAARADAALAAAVVAAAPDLAARVDPLGAARTEHAAALDAEVARLAGADTPPPTSAAPAAPPAATALADLRAAVTASGAVAAAAVLTLPAERVGLVASISACCATYGMVLG